MVVRRFVPSKGTKCHREITLEFLHLIKRTRKTEEERDVGPVPTLSYVQNGGPVDFASSQCTGLVWLLYLATKVFCFTMQLS